MEVLYCWATSTLQKGHQRVPCMYIYIYRNICIYIYICVVCENHNQTVLSILTATFENSQKILKKWTTESSLRESRDTSIFSAYLETFLVFMANFGGRFCISWWKLSCPQVLAWPQKTKPTLFAVIKLNRSLDDMSMTRTRTNLSKPCQTNHHLIIPSSLNWSNITDSQQQLSIPSKFHSATVPASVLPTAVFPKQKPKRKPRRRLISCMGQWSVILHRTGP